MIAWANDAGPMMAADRQSFTPNHWVFAGVPWYSTLACCSGDCGAVFAQDQGRPLANPCLRLILINDNRHGSFFLENLEEVSWHVPS